MSRVASNATPSKPEVERCLGYIRELSGSLGAKVRALSPGGLGPGPPTARPGWCSDLVAHLVRLTAKASV